MGQGFGGSGANSGPFGVPASFTGMTASGETYGIQQGQLNKLRLRPQILNEHAESSREIVGVVSEGNIIGQIFKASQDNINGIELALESAAAVDFDDFEDYADTAALQVEWVASNASYKAELEEAIVYEGDKAMELPGDASIGDEWKRDFTSTDFSGFTGQFHMYATHTYGVLKLKVFVEDSSGNTNSADIITVDDDAWFGYVFQVELLDPDGGTPADLTDIVAIGYRLDDRRNGASFYIDDMFSVPAPGSVDLKLWDMGPTLPVNGVTALDDGTQYEKLGDLGISGQQLSEVKLDLQGGFRTYHIDSFVAGVALEIPDNELLTVGNYYAITINYEDTNVSVYGQNSSFEVNYYENGYAFNTPSEANTISQIGTYNDCMFAIFSTQDVYITRYRQIADAVPNGGSSTTAYTEDDNMVRRNVFVSGIKAIEDMVLDLSIRPAFVIKGSKVEQEYNDDFSDDVTSIGTTVTYLFEPPTVNG